MVALTGIEPASFQFSSVQFSLSSCVFSTVGTPQGAFRALRVADVLPRCCPATRILGSSRSPIPLRAGNPMLADRPGIGIFLARVIQPPPTTGNGALCSISVLNALVRPVRPRQARGEPTAGVPVPAQLPPALTCGLAIDCWLRIRISLSEMRAIACGNARF